MSCGCEISNDVRSRMAAAAAMCAVCPRRGTEVCLPVGIPVRVMVERSVAPPEARQPGDSCPLGRHPDVHGYIRWRWVRWVGVPEPVRRRLRRPEVRARLGLAPLTGEERPPLPLRKFDGCGCVLALKTAWLSCGGRAVLAGLFWVLTKEMQIAEGRSEAEEDRGVIGCEGIRAPLCPSGSASASSAVGLWA